MRTITLTTALSSDNRLFRSLILLAAMLFIFTVDSLAQCTIKGKVSDETTGEPLPGANIVLKGTTLGTITDFDGNFTLSNIPEGNHTISVSFMGYRTIDNDYLFVSGSTITQDFSLKEDNEQLEEVVVIGYGVQKKKLVTGANAQVSGEDLDKMKSTNALQALQGQTAGVNITSTSGQPGESMKVSVRGVGSLTGTSPLYIVDGVQTGDISYLNNSDIESIDILKDAASAAIYGSQASNGVVLITTKSGKAGKSQVYFDGYYGIQNRPKDFDLLNTEQYAMIMNEAALNTGRSVSNLPFGDMNKYAYVNSQVADNDWLDEMFVENAKVQNYTVGATGGNDVSTYAISLGYMSQEGIVGGKDLSNYERYNARINSEHKLYGGILKVGEHLSYSNVKKNGVQVGDVWSNSLRGAFSVSPILPMYDENGDFYNTAKGGYFTSEANPYASMVMNNQNLTKTSNVVGDIYMIIEPIKNLRLRSSLGVDFYGSDYRSFNPVYELSSNSNNPTSKVTQNMTKGTTVSADNTLSYSLAIGQHKIEPMVGMWVQTSKSDYLSANNSDLSVSDFENAYISNAIANDILASQLAGNPSEVKMLSYFGRLQYNFKETYMLNATIRADGSSRFTSKNRWGYFPSVSAGWVVSNESFMENQHIFDFLKIRGSWGQVGNQSITDFQYLATIAFTNALYPFGGSESGYNGDSGENKNGSYPKRLANENLKWETSEQLDFGFDARFLKNTLTVNFDWYKKSTKDWLIVAPVVATAGADAPFMNGGNVDNKGFELAITYQNHVGKFNYQVSLNGSYNKNEITEIPNENGLITGPTGNVWANSPEISRCESGHSVGFFYGYKTAGVFQSQADIDAWKAAGNGILQEKVQPGDVKFVDRDRNGKIDEDDKYDLGSPYPDYTFGFTINLDYKAFDFMVSANGVAGNKIAQLYRDNGSAYANYSTAILDRWHGEGTSNKIPRVTENNINYKVFSDLMLQDGDFLRISNITLGYDLCKQIKVKGFSQMRFYVTCQNAFTFSKYDGMDPEIGFGVSDATYSFSSGMDLGYYPRPRTFLFGISLKL